MQVYYLYKGNMDLHRHKTARSILEPRAVYALFHVWARKALTKFQIKLFIARVFSDSPHFEVASNLSA